MDAVVKDGQVAPFPSIVSDAVAGKMPYLQAVVKEALRIHPPVTDEIQSSLFPPCVCQKRPRLGVEGGKTVRHTTSYFRGKSPRLQAGWK